MDTYKIRIENNVRTTRKQTIMTFTPSAYNIKTIMQLQ